MSTYLSDESLHVSTGRYDLTYLARTETDSRDTNFDPGAC